MSRGFHHNSGFTLIELLLAIFIASLLALGIGFFERNVFVTNRTMQSELREQSQVRAMLKGFTAEVRSALPAWNGAHVIDTASSTTFVFYATLDADQYTERIRYQLYGSSLVRGVSHFNVASGAYDLPEATSTVVTGVSLPPGGRIFTYYDTNYDGTTGYPRLSDPIQFSQVRLVRVDLPVLISTGASTTRRTFTTQVSLRNLKDNY